MPTKRHHRFNPKRFDSLSDPKKLDIFAPPIPLTPEQYLSTNQIRVKTLVIEEWDDTPPFMTALTTEEWDTEAPTQSELSTLTTEEWEHGPPEMDDVTTELWGSNPPSFTSLVTETWG